MDPQAQRPVSFFAMVTDKRNTQNQKSEIRCQRVAAFDNEHSPVA